MAAAFVATVWVEGGLIRVRWPWHKTRMAPLRNEIKARIPTSARAFNPSGKCWDVDPHYDELLLKILEKHCDDVTVLGAPEPAAQAAPAPVPVSGDPAALLISLCPDKALPKVWRAIAAALHPDAGGDAEAFKQASSAWEALRASRGL